MSKEIIETVKHNTAQIARIAFTLEEILRLIKEDQERSRKYMEEKKENKFIAPAAGTWYIMGH